jgi:preprotein translocase subunit Sec63
MKKYYEILGLDMSASIEEVEQAYRELSDVWHPQTYQNLPRYRRKAEIKQMMIKNIMFRPAERLWHQNQNRCLLKKPFNPKLASLHIERHCYMV